mgnify:FL=1|jgi:hypothetical protein|tara:strand:+ start:72 stop:359 length:288 start_codon:yes stop_codon:yes gene_type:complete
MNTYEKERARGLNAQRILDDDLYKESFVYLRDLYFSEWENSPARDSEGREGIWMAIKVLSTVENHLSTIMETGKLADRQIEELSKEAFVNRGAAK